MAMLLTSPRRAVSCRFTLSKADRTHLTVGKLLGMRFLSGWFSNFVPFFFVAGETK